MLGKTQARVPTLYDARGRLLHRPRGGTPTRDLPGTRTPDASCGRTRRQARTRAPGGAKGTGAYRETKSIIPDDLSDETVALPPQEIAPSTPRDAPGVSSPEGLPPEEAPSETSERLSEGVGALRHKAEEIIEELDLLESRLEAAEIEHIAVRDAADRDKERAEKLQAALDAERSGRQEEHPGSWR